MRLASHLSPYYLHMINVFCHLSPVTCHLSPVTCYLSPVTCHLPLSQVAKDQLSCGEGPGAGCVPLLGCGRPGLGDRPQPQVPLHLSLRPLYVLLPPLNLFLLLFFFAIYVFFFFLYSLLFALGNASSPAFAFGLSVFTFAPQGKNREARVGAESKRIP